MADLQIPTVNYGLEPITSAVPGIGIADTLSERGKRYGLFSNNAYYSQSLKAVLESTENWPRLQADQKEALSVIAQKMARILSGDPDYPDNWHDIAGYATLVENRLNGLPNP